MRAALPPSNELHSNPRLLDQVLAPAIHLLGNYVRGVYREGPLADFRFVRLGICRVLSQAASGRDFLQMAREVLGEEVARAFFDSLHCRRRSKVLADLNAELVTRNRSGLEDLLARFPELQGIPVYAVDGHHIDHAVHSPSDRKGEKVSANNLYLLCLHSGLLWNLGAAQETRAHLVALTHNLLILLRRELEREHGIREEKVERKRQEQLIQRQTQARALGRSVAAIQKFLPVAIQLTAQFIRTLLQAKDGTLYGTTQEGGADNSGTIFRFSLSPTQLAPPRTSK